VRILVGIEDLAAGLDDLSWNREALSLLILQGERAAPVEASDRSIPHLLSVGPSRRTAAVGPRRPADDALQVNVIEALERIGTDATARAIEDFLHDRSSLVRERAQRALHALGVVGLDLGKRLAVR
jgi:HEAT repeat protein